MDINETFFASEMAYIKDDAQLNGQTSETISVQVTGYDGSTSTKKYAKYLKIDGKVFTGAAYDAKYNGEVVKYTADGIADLFDYVNSSAANAQWYYTAVENHNISIVKNAAGDAFETAVVLGAVQNDGALFKADVNSTYWVQGSKYPLGWKGNVAKVKEALIGKALFEAPAITRDATSKVWSLGGVATGSTINAFDKYVALAVNAFNGTEGIVAHYAPFIHGKAILVGRTEMNVAADGKISYVAFNETFFCTYISVLSKTAAPAEAAYYSIDTAATDTAAAFTTYYAKYLKIAGKVFTGAVATRAAALSGEKGIYSADGISDLVTYVQAEEANAEWYYLAMRNNDISILKDAEGSAFTTPVSIAYPGDPFKADANNAYGYHGTTLAFNWKKNIAAMENFLVGKELTALLVGAKADTNTNPKNWYVDGVDTGATLSEFNQYMGFALTAYSYANL
jgi:hypothetical protein